MVTIPPLGLDAKLASTHTHSSELIAFQSPRNQELQDLVGPLLAKSPVYLFDSGAVRVTDDFDMQSLVRKFHYLRQLL